MCFGRGKSQNKPDDCQFSGVNNFCGGFAAYAVLEDMGKGTNPMSVYSQIQDYQIKNVLSDSSQKSSKFLIETVQNGTLMSLPSGICSALLNPRININIVVFYTEDCKSLFEEGIITEEETRIQNLNVKIQSGDIKDVQIMKYVIVLVNKCHWVAAKKMEDNRFVCYDPVDGSVSGPNEEIEKILSRKGYAISGLNIGVSSL